MRRIRSIVLDLVVLFGMAVSAIATLDGYAHSLPERVEHVVSAIEKLDVEITGSVTKRSAMSSAPASQPRS